MSPHGSTRKGVVTRRVRGEFEVRSRGAAGLLLLVVGTLVVWLLIDARPTPVPAPDPNRGVGLDTPVERRRVRRAGAEVAGDEGSTTRHAESETTECRVVVTGAPPELVRVDLWRDGPPVAMKARRNGEYLLPRAPGRLSVRAEGRVTEFVQLTGIEKRVDVALRPGRACWIRIQDARQEPLHDARLHLVSHSPGGRDVLGSRAADEHGLVRIDLEPRGDATTLYVRATSPRAAPSESFALPHWEEVQWTRDAPRVVTLTEGVGVELVCRSAATGNLVSNPVLESSHGRLVRSDDSASDGRLSFRLRDPAETGGYGWNGVVRAPGHGEAAIDLTVGEGVEVIRRVVELPTTWSTSVQVVPGGNLPEGTRALFRYGLHDSETGGSHGTQVRRRVLSVPADGLLVLEGVPVGVIPVKTELVVVTPDFRAGRLAIGGPSRNARRVVLSDPPRVHPAVKVVRRDGAALVGGRVRYLWCPGPEQVAVFVAERAVPADRPLVQVPESRGGGRWIVRVWDQETLPSDIDTTETIPDVVGLVGATAVSGTVTRADGSPVQRAHVLVRWGEEFLVRSTSPDGRFRMRIPADIVEAELTVRSGEQRVVRRLEPPTGPVRIELK